MYLCRFYIVEPNGSEPILAIMMCKEESVFFKSQRCSLIDSKVCVAI